MCRSLKRFLGSLKVVQGSFDEYQKVRRVFKEYFTVPKSLRVFQMLLRVFFWNFLGDLEGAFGF